MSKDGFSQELAEALLFGKRKVLFAAMERSRVVSAHIPAAASRNVGDC
jgi:hypothetical protein